MSDLNLLNVLFVHIKILVSQSVAVFFYILCIDFIHNIKHKMYYYTEENENNKKRKKHNRIIILHRLVFFFVMSA